MSGNIGALQAASAPDLQKDFSGVAQAVAALKPDASGTVTLRALFVLEAPGSPDVPRTGPDAALFYCGDGPQRVTFTLPGLAAGRYAVVFAHVSGVPAPRQVSLVLQQLSGGWKVAGFVQKPLLQAGHDSVWYWQHARDLLKKHEPWNATLSFQIAIQLGTPVEFVSSTNLEKLFAERQAAQPADFPTAEKPLPLQVQGKTVSVLGLAALVSADATAGLTALVPYHTPSPASAGTEGAFNSALGFELQRKVPELSHFLAQLLIQYAPDGTATVFSLASVPSTAAAGAGIRP